MKLGLSGILTRTFINSPLTPLLLLAALVAGALAVFSLPREEEPQISVPMVDILVSANGYKADEAVELVTRPLEDIVKGINGVEHVYSQTQDDRTVVTARFFVGTDEDTAVLRIHEKIRANIADLPKGIPEPLIIGRGINDVAIIVLTLSAQADKAAEWTDNGLLQVVAGASARTDQGRRRRRNLCRRRQPHSDPRRARSGTPCAVRDHPRPGDRQARQRQPVVPGGRVPRRRAFRACRRGPDAPGRSRYRVAVADVARRPTRLCQGCRRCRRSGPPRSSIAPGR